MDNLLIPVTLINSQRRPNQLPWASKRNTKMPSISTLSFRELSENMQQLANRGEVSASSLPNLNSALRAFLTSFGLNETSLVGTSLRSMFYRNMATHLEQLKTEGRESGYIANRKSLMSKWASLVNQLDRIEAARTNTYSPFQLALKELIEKSNTSITGLAKAAGIYKGTLRSWTLGSLPQPRALPSLRRLERFFALAPESLVKLAFDNRYFKPTEEVPTEKIEYRERLATNVRDRYRLKIISASLADEWQDLLIYKTEWMPELNRHERGVWVATEHFTKGVTDANKHCFVKGKYVPTSLIVWGYVTGYLGWLARSREKDGMGMPIENVQSLAWLTHKTYVHRFMKWLIERANDKVHAGIIDFAKIVCSLNHPEHGYLTQRPELNGRMPPDYRHEAWAETCKEVYKWAADMKKKLSARGMKHSRSPMEPIMNVLELDNPLDAVKDMCRRMRACRPTTGGSEEAVWLRDIVLIKLTSSNPLRAKNLKLLTYRTDNTGQLYQKPDGSWHIHIKSSVLKNFRGAGKDDYHMPVGEGVWEDLERYLKVYRPMLPDSDTLDFVFLSSVTEKTPGFIGPWQSLNRRVFKLTAKFLWNCPGIGVHGLRYIVGTTVMKNGGTWDDAGAVLHDDPETVKKHYTHIRGCDRGDKVLALLGKTLAQM